MDNIPPPQNLPPPTRDLAEYQKSKAQQDLEYLLKFKEPGGGFSWSAAELSSARALIKLYPEYRGEFAWLPWTLDVTPDSKFSHLAEQYVKRVILEEFGVLCQIKSMAKDKMGNDQWIMTGVCPFHRRVHRSQNWYINQKKDASIIGCFHANAIYGRLVNPFVILGKLPF
jgi:hypothetical protein